MLNQWFAFELIIWLVLNDWNLTIWDLWLIRFVWIVRNKYCSFKWRLFESMDSIWLLAWVLSWSLLLLIRITSNRFDNFMALSSLTKVAYAIEFSWIHLSYCLIYRHFYLWFSSITGIHGSLTYDITLACITLPK